MGGIGESSTRVSSGVGDVPIDRTKLFRRKISFSTFDDLDHGSGNVCPQPVYGCCDGR